MDVAVWLRLAVTLFFCPGPVGSELSPSVSNAAGPPGCPSAADVRTSVVVGAEGLEPGEPDSVFQSPISTVWSRAGRAVSLHV